MPETIDAIKILIAFIMPGFVTDFIISFAVPRAKRTSQETILTTLTFSCVNYALFSWLVLIINNEAFYSEHKVFYIILWTFILLIAPILEGMLFVWLANSHLSKMLLQFLKPKNVRLTPTAWDYIFSQEQRLWILITLNDDSRIGGFFGEKSFVSEYPQAQDIYLEQVWHLGDNGEFKSPVADSAGCLIKMQDIKYLEFFKVE